MAFNKDFLKIYSEISDSMEEAEEKFFNKFKKRPILKPKNIQWTQTNSVQYLLSLMVNIPVMSECKIWKLLRIQKILFWVVICGLQKKVSEMDRKISVVSNPVNFIKAIGLGPHIRNEAAPWPKNSSEET